MLSRGLAFGLRTFTRARSTASVTANAEAHYARSTGYSARMDARGNPLSPSLFIYRYPAIALSSITVRITGVFLTIGA